MRGTPLMLQMLFIYFALPFRAGDRLCGCQIFLLPWFAFALNYAAYFR